EAFFFLALGRFCPLSLRDVSPDHEDAENSAQRILDRGDRYGDVDSSSVFRDAVRLIMFNPLTGSQASLNLHVLFTELARNDDCNRLSDCFGRRISKHPLRASVPA